MTLRGRQLADDARGRCSAGSRAWQGVPRSDTPPQGLAPITLQRPQEALQALLELGGRGFGVQHQRRSERLMVFEVAGASCGSRSLSVWF
jgi:hypothetical protein